MAIVNIPRKLSNLKEYWAPETCGDVGDVFIKILKVKGDYVWHAHENEDVIYYVLEGTLRLKFRESRDIVLDAGEMYKIPRRTEHLPTAEAEAQIMMIEPQSISLNKGDRALTQIFMPEVDI